MFLAQGNEPLLDGVKSLLCTEWKAKAVSDLQPTKPAGGLGGAYGARATRASRSDILVATCAYTDNSLPSFLRYNKRPQSRTNIHILGEGLL